jgi:regulator of sigma E protease
VRPGDTVTGVRFKAVDFQGKVRDGSWQPVGADHYAYLDSTLQQQAPHVVDLKVKRAGEEDEQELLDLTAAEDTSWPVAADGLIFGKELRILKADGVGEALGLGLQRTLRMVKQTYQGLSSLIAGRVSVKLMSGPITLARAGYIFAGESVWKLLLLVGLISVNLAVVNFLPIPVLDGGHMVFLIYEGIRRKPAPVLVQNILTIVGLAMVLSLMLFTIGLDIWRLLFW